MTQPGYSDQPFWIIWAVCELIKETGDYSLLDMEIDYRDEGYETMLEQVKAAVNRLIEDNGNMAWLTNNQGSMPAILPACGEYSR